MTEHERTGLLKRLMYFWPLVILCAGAIAFWSTTGSELKANEKWHDDCQKKVETHETRISNMEGKIDQVITLQHEILRRMK
jgi:hypothetical protein